MKATVRLQERTCSFCTVMLIATNTTKVLGRGGYGTVFEGDYDGKKVAVKRIELARAEDNNNREEEALRKFNHPNVIKLYHVESDANFRYYAMELCEASMEKLFLNEDDPEKYCKQMPPPEDVLLQLASGLAYIHSKDLVHRDLKPQNVLIWVGDDENEEQQVLLKWADFGLSKKVNERGSFSVSGVQGSENWFAPEILKMWQNYQKSQKNNRPQKRGTIKSDVFAEGCVFGYFLLDGQHPYGSYNHEIQTNISKNDPVNMRNAKAMRADFRDLIKKNMLAEKPENRKSSAEIVELLNKLINTRFQNEKKLLGLCGADKPNLNQIQSLVNKGISVNCVNPQGATPFLQLLRNRRNHAEGNLIETIHFFLEKGIDVNAVDKTGKNALHYFCQHYTKDDFFDIIKLLIDNKIDINGIDNDGRTPSVYLFLYNHPRRNLLQILQLLIQQGTTVDCGRTEVQTTIRKHYTSEESEELLKFLAGPQGSANGTTDYDIDDTIPPLSKRLREITSDEQ